MSVNLADNIKRGYFVFSYQPHTSHGHYLAQAILLDKICVGALQKSNSEILSWDGGRITIRRRIYDNIGSGYLTAQKKWVTVCDDEMMTNTQEDIVKMQAGNQDELIIGGDSTPASLPVWLNSCELKRLNKLAVMIDTKVSHLSEMADFVAATSCRKELCKTPAIGNDYYNKRMDLGSGIKISKDFLFPVEWDKDCFGVVKVDAACESRLEGTLFVCQSDKNPSTGTVLYRESAWKLDSTTAYHRSEIGKILFMAQGKN